jgi:hypothetical protein
LKKWVHNSVFKSCKIIAFFRNKKTLKKKDFFHKLFFSGLINQTSLMCEGLPHVDLYKCALQFTTGETFIKQRIDFRSF